MNKKNVVLLGKGSLAIKVANWFFENENLVAVVPDMPEPTWTDSLAEWAKSKNVPYFNLMTFCNGGSILLCFMLMVTISSAYILI